MEVNYERLLKTAKYLVFKQEDAYDIAHEAWISSRTREKNVPIRYLILDAFRKYYRYFWNPKTMKHERVDRELLFDDLLHTNVKINDAEFGMAIDEMVTSIYKTDQQLIERYIDEENEDQEEEWNQLTAAEKDRRVAEGMIGVGTSVEKNYFKRQSRADARRNR